MTYFFNDEGEIVEATTNADDFVVQYNFRKPFLRRDFHDLDFYEELCEGVEAQEIEPVDTPPLAGILF